MNDLHRAFIPIGVGGNNPYGFGYGDRSPTFPFAAASFGEGVSAPRVLRTER